MDRGVIFEDLNNLCSEISDNCLFCHRKCIYVAPGFFGLAAGEETGGGAGEGRGVGR
jgi:hypothetical protein